jgi:ribosomal protein S1
MIMMLIRKLWCNTIRFIPNTLAGINKLYDPTSIIGETFQVMIESFSEYEGTYIVSRRKYLQSLIQKSKFIRI